MEGPCETHCNGEVTDNGHQVIRYSPTYQPCVKLSPAWFELRVFYVRVSNFKVDDSTPEFLTLNHVPLSPDTILDLNGSRTSIYSDGVSSLLRRDRADKKLEEATFVVTDSIRLTGSLKFQVFDKEDLILSGILEMSNTNGFTAEMKNSAKRWSMNCESEVTPAAGFLKGKHFNGAAAGESPAPTMEVYLAGCFAGTPLILTKTLQLCFHKKHIRKGMLDAIPENDTGEAQKDMSPEQDLQLVEYRSYKPDNEEVYSNMYWRKTEYMEGEDGELSWFNAGVRVGVGIGLGICLGIGIGVGLMVRTYQTTTRNFKRRLL